SGVPALGLGREHILSRRYSRDFLVDGEAVVLIGPEVRRAGSFVRVRITADRVPAARAGPRRSAVLESGVEHEILALGLIGEHADRRRRRLPRCGGAVERVSAGTPDPCNGFAPGNLVLLGSGIGEGEDRKSVV